MGGIPETVFFVIWCLMSVFCFAVSEIDKNKNEYERTLSRQWRYMGFGTAVCAVVNIVVLIKEIQ